jgi:hypothetical protein
MTRNQPAAETPRRGFLISVESYEGTGYFAAVNYCTQVGLCFSIAGVLSSLLAFHKEKRTMPLSLSHRVQDGLQAMRQETPGLAELAAAITDALDEEKVEAANAARQLLYLMCLVRQNPYIGGPLLLAQLQVWYLEGALSQGAFSLLTPHATALICA